MARNRRGNHNRNRNKPNYTPNVYIGRDQNFNKLILNKNLEDILKNISDNVIAVRILNDSKKNNINTRISWLNITKSVEHISYTTPDRIKSPNDEWLKKNRTPVLIKNLIKKLYKKEFTNYQIRIFLNKFKTSYENFINKNKDEKKGFNDEKILNDLINKTENGFIDWHNVMDNDWTSKFRSRIHITPKKYILIELYYSKDTNSFKSFISFHLVDNVKKELITRIEDDVAAFLIKSIIEKYA